MVEAETIVIRPPIVANPFAVTVDVWGFGMIVAVPKRAPVLALVAIVFVLVTMIGRGTMARNISSTDVVVPVVSIVVVVFLGECRQREDHDGGED
jgi:predicted tellurium resistance membrane protein TerC